MVGDNCLSIKNCKDLPVTDLFGTAEYSLLDSLVICRSTLSLLTVSLTNASNTSIAAVLFTESTLYVVVPETKATVFWLIVHWFNPRLDHSANNKFKLLLAVLRSYAVRNSRPHLSNASSI